MKIEEHTLRDDDGRHLATVTPAGNAEQILMLAADPDSEDGRSPWVWVRLANGDLLFGTFPQGDTYEDVAQHYAV